ncbi:unnamed protein product, partial [Urochloa humidicola]
LSPLSTSPRERDLSGGTAISGARSPDRATAEQIRARAARIELGQGRAPARRPELPLRMTAGAPSRAAAMAEQIEEAEPRRGSGEAGNDRCWGSRPDPLLPQRVPPPLHFQIVATHSVPSSSATSPISPQRARVTTGPNLVAAARGAAAAAGESRPADGTTRKTTATASSTPRPPSPSASPLRRDLR